MAKLATSISVLFSLLLFLLTLSSARDIHAPEKQTLPEPKKLTHSNSKTNQHDTVSFTLDSSDSVPLTYVTFRPINRHIAQRPLPLPLSLRLGHRRCRHGHRIQIPYGNDAIVRSDAASAVDPSNRGVSRQIPTRWVRIRHGEPRFTEMVPREHHHRVHSKLHRDEEHKKKGWFEKKIDVFLNMFRF